MENTVLSSKSVADLKKELHQCYAHRRDSQRKIIELAAQIRRSNAQNQEKPEAAALSLLRPRKAESDEPEQNERVSAFKSLESKSHHASLLSFPHQTKTVEEEGKNEEDTNVISLKAKRLDKMSRMKSFQKNNEEPARKRDVKKGSLLGSSMFRGLQAHLKRASTNLAKEKTHLEKQKEVVRKIDEDLKKENLQLKEQKVEQLQKKKEDEIKQKRKLDKRVKSVSNQLTTEIIVSHSKKLANFIMTKTEPHILWRPTNFNSALEEARKKNEAQIKTRMVEFKELQAKALEQELKAYDKKVEEIEARRQKRLEEKVKGDLEEQIEEEEEEEELVVVSEGEEKTAKEEE